MAQVMINVSASSHPELSENLAYLHRPLNHIPSPNSKLSEHTPYFQHNHLSI
jgi:hypothetical protein